MNIETVQETQDGGFIVNGTLAVPADSGNRHHRAVVDWIAAGNTPDAAPEPAAPEPGEAEILRDAMQAKGLLDRAALDAARTRLRGRR